MTAPAQAEPLAQTPEAVTAPAEIPAAPLAEAAPTAIPAMEEFREQQFRDRAVARLKAGLATGLTAEQILGFLVEEQKALAVATADPAMLEAASGALFAAKQQAITDPSFATSKEQAEKTMAQIFSNRAADARAFAAKLEDPGFTAPLLEAARAANDAAPAATATLEQVKHRELVEELSHVGADGKAQVLAHIDAFRDGTLITHRALADVFAPKGPLHEPLTNALKAQLPGADQARIHAIAMEWLTDREAAATTTVALIGNDGAAYREAAARSERDRPAAVPPAKPVLGPFTEQALASKPPSIQSLEL